MKDKYYKLYDELVETTREILPYYDIDKIKPYSVYIWSKEDKNDPTNWGSNVFDINANEIVFYDKNHKIIKEALPIINKIQYKLKEIEIEIELKKEQKRI